MASCINTERCLKTVTRTPEGVYFGVKITLFFVKIITLLFGVQTAESECLILVPDNNVTHTGSK